MALRQVKGPAGGAYAGGGPVPRGTLLLRATYTYQHSVDWLALFPSYPEHAQDQGRTPFTVVGRSLMKSGSLGSGIRRRVPPPRGMALDDDGIMYVIDPEHS